MMLIVELCALLEERNHLSAGALPLAPMGLLTSLPDPLAVFWGLLLKERGGRDFVLCPRKKRSRRHIISYVLDADMPMLYLLNCV